MIVFFSTLEIKVQNKFIYFKQKKKSSNNIIFRFIFLFLDILEVYILKKYKTMLPYNNNNKVKLK
jgi:hypothetical protein